MALLDRTDSEIDQYFGLSPSLKSQHNIEETYTDGLTSAEALYTSYKDLDLIRKDAEKRNMRSLADLGSGISRMSFLFNETSSSVQCHCYEVVEERVLTAQEAFLKHFKHPAKGIHNHNLRKDLFPKHDAYFIYLPVGKSLRKIIRELKKITHEEIILYVIESHGDLLSFLKTMLPELKVLETYSLNGKRHHPELHVFSYKRDLQLKKEEEDFIHESESQLQNKEKVLFSNQKPPTNGHILTLLDLLEEEKNHYQILIQDQVNQEWVGDLSGYQNGAREGTIDLLNPPRMIKLESVLGLINPQDDLIKLIQKRRDKKLQPLPRKIFLKPLKQVEYSDGSILAIPE